MYSCNERLLASREPEDLHVPESFAQLEGDAMCKQRIEVGLKYIWWHECPSLLQRHQVFLPVFLQPLDLSLFLFSDVLRVISNVIVPLERKNANVSLLSAPPGGEFYR